MAPQNRIRQLFFSIYLTATLDIHRSSTGQRLEGQGRREAGARRKVSLLDACRTDYNLLIMTQVNVGLLPVDGTLRETQCHQLTKQF